MENGRKTEEQLTQEIMQEEDRIKTRIAIELARNGKETNKIIEKTGLTVGAIKWLRKKEGIMSRPQVRDLIIEGKSDEEVKERANWTLKAVTEMRQEIEDRKSRRQADRKERADRRNAMLKEQRQEGIQARREEQEKKDQILRVALAQGLPIEEIATLVGYKYPHTVSVTKSKKGLLGRKEIIALLPEKSDEDLMEITGINDISVIQKIRKEEMPKIEAAKKAAEEAAEQERKKQEEKQRKKEAEEARNQAFLIALAQGKTGEEVAKLVGLKNANSVKQKKHDMKALNRKQIIVLLPEKSDEDIMEITRINNISVIKKIRQEEMPETIQVEPIIPKQDEETFLKLAQSLTSVKKIAEQLGLTEEQVRDALYDYNIFTREEIIEWLDSKSNVQIAIMGNLDYTVVEKVRKEERRLAEGERILKPTTPEAQKKKEEKMFFRMARNYEPVEKIESVFQMDQYKIILKLRKLKLYSRAEVERMLERGGTSDVQIAGENGNVNAVGRIRRKVQKREILIRSIPEEKRAEVRRKVSSGVAVSSIAYDTRVNISIIRAIQEKWKRDKALEISDDRKKVDFKRTWIDLKSSVCTLEKSSSDYQKNKVQYMIEKILVKYEMFLTQSHYAYMAYAYMKMEKNEEGIEFAVEYLNLQSSSTKAVKDRIDEILNQERGKESPRATDNSQNMGTGWPDLDSI